MSWLLTPGPRALRTAAGRLPSESRLILIMARAPARAPARTPASVADLPDGEPHGDRHHRTDRIEPGAVERPFLPVHAAQRVHQLGRHLEALAQDLLEVRRQGAAAGEHQLVDRALGGGGGEEVEGL